ncbi:Uncharacterised protein [Salmonella enterica]|uniref:Uncharacterized protein n=1 Tax=Salmonella enterica TaxID=28901 RepID=A0A379SEH2_SALER|nr:Uncharacterised protein [Salmonella enterica]
MKKIAIVSGLVLAVCSGMAYASAGDSTLTVGYAQIHSHGLKDAVKSDRDFAALMVAVWMIIPIRMV